MGKNKTYRTDVKILIGAIAIVMTTAPILHAQATHPRLAVFTPGLAFGVVHEGMQEGLKRFGYQEGKNITFLMEDTKGGTADLPARAATLIAAKADLIFAVTNPHTLAAKHATTTVPVVFAWVGNPVSFGLVASYPYSKSNLTGVTASSDALSGKRLEILLEIAPKAKRLLVMVAAKESISVSSFNFLEEAAQKFAVKLVRRDVTNEEEIKTVLEKTSKGSVDAIFTTPSILMRSSMDLLIKKAKLDRIPISVNEDGLVDRGALFSYGAYSRLVGLQAAHLVNKILKGSSPGEIKVESPDKFFLAINQTTAKQIGLIIPHGILGQADRLVQ